MIIDTTCSVAERKMKESKKSSRSFNEPSGWISIGSIDNIFVSNQCLSVEEVKTLSEGSFTCTIHWNESYSDISISENSFTNVVTSEAPTITWGGEQLQDNSVTFNFD